MLSGEVIPAIHRGVEMQSPRCPLSTVFYFKIINKSIKMWSPVGLGSPMQARQEYFEEGGSSLHSSPVQLKSH